MTMKSKTYHIEKFFSMCIVGRYENRIFIGFQRMFLLISNPSEPQSINAYTRNNIALTKVPPE
jgi:hypothetical protein